jgi:ubiquitin-protein ligase E3 C
MIQVTFISEHGVQEAGIDGGGVFKEFMDALSRIAFNPETGLFMLTTDQLLMPNPLSDMTFDDHVSHFAFLGRILGKAMYEQILIEPMFSLVFLNILLGRINHLDDLYSLDSEMYRSLVRLKHIAAQGEDLSSLGLFFEVTVQRFGVEETIELIPGGSTTPVTAANIITYIHRLSHFKLNVQTANQTRAFLDGFRDLIPVDWIRMFSARELQLLIGGDIRAIDVVNMRSHTHYTGGYHDTQPYIQWFWEVLESMSPDEQAAFLKFTTSCPRQPLLGFQNLTPQFCIQRVPARQPQDSPDAPPRLPSTATCMNLMKLPQYDSKEQLKEKLLYAVKFNSGFELS